MRTAIILLSAITLTSCVKKTVEYRPPTTAPAVLHTEALGRVVEVGSDPTTWLALESLSGGQTRLSGSGSAMLRAVPGAIVWVSGNRTATEIMVDVFEVRRVGELEVDDGIVVAATNGVELRLRNGTTRPVPLATPALRAIAGARVWISRPVDGVTPSYGVIAARP